MPYITNAEQGRPDPTSQVMQAQQQGMQQQLLRQQMAQSAARFPIEQQTAQAGAKEASAKADTIQRTILLQQTAQDTQNKIAQTQLQFNQETDPIKKQQLQAQLTELNGQIENLKFQGQLLQSQSDEAKARGGLYSAEAIKDNPAAAPYNTTVVPGKLDPYGNQVSTTNYTDPTTGKVLRSQDTFEKGRGIPRVAYRQVPGPNGQLMREPGVVGLDEQGNMTVNFPSDSKGGQPDADASQRTSATDALVQKYFDTGTGAPRTGIFGGTTLPKTASDRAQLRTLLTNPSLVKEYGLNPTADLTKVLGVGTPDQTSPTAPGMGSSAPVKPSSVTSGSGNQDDMSRNGDAGPSGAIKLPALQSPQDTPPAAGVAAGGTAIKAGADAVPASPTASPAPVPIMSGRARTPGAAGTPPVGTVAGAPQPTVSGKKGSKFSDLPSGSYFMQNGVRYKKTSATGAIPAEDDASQTAPATPSTQSPSLPSAQGM